MWSPLLDWMKNDVLPRGLFDRHDLHNIFHINEPDRVVQFIRTASANI